MPESHSDTEEVAVESELADESGRSGWFLDSSRVRLGAPSNGSAAAAADDLRGCCRGKEASLAGSYEQ